MTMLILSKQDRDEHETERLVESFTNQGCVVKVCNPNDFDLIVDGDLTKGVNYQGERIELPQMVLVRMGAGITPFQLAVIRHLEQSGVTCINSSNSIEIVKDKLRTSQILSRNKIAIPNTMMVRFPIDQFLVANNIGFPCVVKVVTGSYGEGVYLCEKEKDFKKLMELIDNLGGKKSILVQEYMGERPGEDLRVLVIGGKVIGAMKRTAPEGDFRANISSGGTGCPYPVTEEIETMALSTAGCLGLEIAGIDLLFDKAGFRVCEANSNPGFKGFETYCEIDVADKIARYVRSKT